SKVSSVKRISSSGDLWTWLIFGVSETSFTVGAWLTLKTARVRLTRNKTDGLDGVGVGFESRHEEKNAKF
ncbi:hypothetical protein DKP78_26320, partial [Enterococcus faecium]